MRRPWWQRRSDRARGSRELPAEATLRVRPGSRGVGIRVERGLLHVTQAGDPVDHVVQPGEVLRLPRGGLVVAFALAPSRLAVFDPHGGQRAPRTGSAVPRGARVA